MGQTKCATCNDGQWINRFTVCKECIGYSKWTPLKKPKPAPKPIYIGHRDGEIWE